MIIFAPDISLSCFNGVCAKMPPDEDASSTFDDELRSIASISNLADDEVFSLEEPMDDDGIEPGYEAENNETSVD